MWTAGFSQYVTRAYLSHGLNGTKALSAHVTWEINICYKPKLLVQVIAWFAVISGINATSDISKLLYVISRAFGQVKFETILKYHEWYLCQIPRTNRAIICLYYCPQRFCNFHM